MMIIDCISDLHGYFPELAGGDLLIIAGDLTARDEKMEFIKFLKWLDKQEYKRKIFISGNHDMLHETYPVEYDALPKNVEYLCNSGTEFDDLKIWGTPHSLIFDGVNPNCTAFMGTEKELKESYDLIPDDIDILISHSPPYGILDAIKRDYRKIEHTGSHSLLKAMCRVKPKIMVFGHIHEHGGEMIDLMMTKCINASYVNEFYQPVNKPVRIKYHFNFG
jgi:Icc-related predicted phosphoesterase